MDLNTFRSMSYGVYVVSTMDKGRPTGCIANSIMQVTPDPATVALSMNHDNYTTHCIKETGTFAFSILSEKSDPGLIGSFGFCSGKDVCKFDGVEYEVEAGMPVLKDSCGYVVCKVIDTMETATHTVFLAEVTEAEIYDSTSDAMTYAYYHNVIKGKSPKNAPTYLPDEPEEKKPETSKKKWICNICGFVYEGDELPEDYICPICKKGADKFSLIQ